MADPRREPALLSMSDQEWREAQMLADDEPSAAHLVEEVRKQAAEIASLTRERDEARAEAVRMRSLVITGRDDLRKALHGNNGLGRTWQQLVADVATKHADHSACHDLVCNGSRRHPRGTPDVSCSCGTRDERQMREIARLHEEIDRLKALFRKLDECPGLCDPDCEGRCRVCPVDVIRDALRPREEPRS